MKKRHEESVTIPEGIECNFLEGELTSKKGDITLTKRINDGGFSIKIADGKISIVCEKANKSNIKIMRSNVANIKNVFRGLENDFSYELEICHVHFPMTVKVEGQKLIVSNFLGEKKNRIADIMPGVNVEVSGKSIKVTGRDINSAGQTAANIEKLTKVRGKDRRIFQDGIFMTVKKGRSI